MIAAASIGALAAAACGDDRLVRVADEGGAGGIVGTETPGAGGSIGAGGDGGATGGSDRPDCSEAVEFGGCDGDEGARCGDLVCVTDEILPESHWLHPCTRTVGCPSPGTFCLAESAPNRNFCVPNHCDADVIFDGDWNGAFFERCSARYGYINEGFPDAFGGTCLPIRMPGGVTRGLCFAAGASTTSCTPLAPQTAPAKRRCAEGMTCLQSGVCVPVCNAGTAGPVGAFGGCEATCTPAEATPPASDRPYALGACVD